MAIINLPHYYMTDGSLSATLSIYEAKTALVTADGDAIVDSNGDAIGIYEHGVNKVTATLTPMTVLWTEGDE